MKMTDGCQPVEDLGQALVDVARCRQAGKFVCIISKTALGVEWESEHLKKWFTNVHAARVLVKGWDDRMGSVGWSFDGRFDDGSVERVFVVVPAHFMREIKEWLEALDGRVGTYE